MHPEQIKAELRMRGITLTALAEEMGVTRPTVTQVVNGSGRSARIMSRISAILGKPVDSIWTPRPRLRRASKPVAAEVSA